MTGKGPGDSDTPLLQTRKYFGKGTYAAKVWFDNGQPEDYDDSVVETFWIQSPSSQGLLERYAECDFEYLPYDFWSADKSPGIWMTTWDRAIQAEKDSHSSKTSLKGKWVGLIIRVDPGVKVEYLLYDLSGPTATLLDEPYSVEGDFAPELDSAMLVLLNQWIEMDETIDSDYLMKVDWIMHIQDDTTYDWDSMASLVDLCRAGEIKRVNKTRSIFSDFKDDLIGTWESSGVWYRNSETGGWIPMNAFAQLIATGDIDGDYTSDLIRVWNNALWVNYSKTKTSAKISAELPTTIASGDIDGDSRDDVLGSWASSGIWYRNSITGKWILMCSIPVDLVSAGDLDGDTIDDLITVSSKGLWVKKSTSKAWIKIWNIPPTDIAAGDMNGDGRDDLVGNWASSGVWYRNSITGKWVLMSSPPAFLVAAGDIDGDTIDDLIGVWGSGLWVKKSSTSGWVKIPCSSLPRDIDAGLFRTGETTDSPNHPLPT